MGSSHSHPTFPPSPIPHSKSGPPPRPLLSRHADPLYASQINTSTSSLASLLPSGSLTPRSKSNTTTTDSPSPSRSSSPFRRFKRSNTNTPPSAAGAAAPKTRLFGTSDKASTWDIGPHSNIMNLERGKARTWGGPGREFTKTEEETQVNRVKGRWVNRVKIGEGGEAWFY